MNWTSENTLKLIQMFYDRPALWNTRLKEYKDRNIKHDALSEISAHFNINKEEIERKIKNIVSHFLREVRKEKDSMKSGAGRDEIYRSKWFAYDSLLFLKDKNKAQGMDDTETQGQKLSEDGKETSEETQNIDLTQTPLDPDKESSETSTQGSKRQFKSPPKRDSKKKLKASPTAEALSIMKKIQARNELKDQYTAFREQVGLRIRDLPSEHAKKIAKNLISNILFEAEMGKYDNPYPYSHSSSQPAFHLPQFSQQPFPYTVPASNPSRFSPHPQHSSNPSPVNSQSVSSPTPSSHTDSETDLDSYFTLLN